MEEFEDVIPAGEGFGGTALVTPMGEEDIFGYS